MNRFDVKAKKIERTFIRKLKLGSYFLTGKGKQNNIVGYTNKVLYIKTEMSKKSFSISRTKLKRAIAYLLYKRTATRRDLEAFAAYNSALMGLLKLILFDIAKIHHTAKGLLRLTIKGVRFFFSGLDKPSKIDLEAIISNRGMFILNSYFYLRNRGRNLEKWMGFLEANNLRLVVDSGAFSLFNAVKNAGKKIVTKAEYVSLTKEQIKERNVIKEITVEDYATFINQYKHLIHGFFNLDVIGDAKASQDNFEQLTKMTGTKPIPVWHCNIEDWSKSDFELLDRMVEEDHEVIAIGATVMLGRKAGVRKQSEVKRKLFEEIFKRHPLQNFHLLGNTSSLLLEFPFFSADSTGWIQARKNYQIYTLEDLNTSTMKMESWSKEKCLKHNVRVLATLEDSFESMQMKMNLLAAN